MLELCGSQRRQVFAVWQGLLARIKEKGPDAAHPQVMEALDHTFRPEFLNRLDEVILFHQLTPKITAASSISLPSWKIALIPALEAKGRYFTVPISTKIAKLP